MFGISFFGLDMDKGSWREIGIQHGGVLFYSGLAWLGLVALHFTRLWYL